MKIDIYVVNGEPCIPLDQVAGLIKQARCSTPHMAAQVQAQALPGLKLRQQPVGLSGQQIAQVYGDLQPQEAGGGLRGPCIAD